MDRGAWLGYNPWGHKELDTTELLSTHTHIVNLQYDMNFRYMIE